MSYGDTADDYLEEIARHTLTSPAERKPLGAKAFVDLIRVEMAWCKAHPGASNKNPDFEDGFIKGLWQAIYLIEKAETYNRPRFGGTDESR